MDLNRENECEHLRREHGLTKVTAWVAVPSEPIVEDPAQSSSAARMARLRTRRREAGLINIDVPAAIVAEVKAAGGWEAWRNAVGRAAVQGDLERGARSWCLPLSAMAKLMARPTGWQRLVVTWVVLLRHLLARFKGS